MGGVFSSEPKFPVPTQDEVESFQEVLNGAPHVGGVREALSEEFEQQFGPDAAHAAVPLSSKDASNGLEELGRAQALLADTEAMSESDESEEDYLLLDLDSDDEEESSNHAEESSNLPQPQPQPAGEVQLKAKADTQKKAAKAKAKQAAEAKKKAAATKKKAADEKARKVAEAKKKVAEAKRKAKAAEKAKADAELRRMLSSESLKRETALAKKKGDATVRKRKADEQKSNDQRKKARLEVAASIVECVTEHRQDLEWMRVPYRVFTRKPNPRDVRQGCLNNCYFICALEAIAEHRPDAIEECIRPIASSADGTRRFEVRLFTKYGHEYYYTVDDRFWCDVDSVFHSNAEPWMMYSSSPTHALWPSLIEKAFALHAAFQQRNEPASYEGIEGVYNVSDVIAAVVKGYDHRKYWNEHMMPRTFDEMSRVFASIQAAIKKDLFICAGTKGDHAIQDHKGAALYGSHMYVIAQACWLQGKPMLLIRNVHNRRATAVKTAFTTETSGTGMNLKQFVANGGTKHEFEKRDLNRDGVVDALEAAPKLGKKHMLKEEQPEFRVSLRTFQRYFRSFEIGKFPSSTFGGGLRQMVAKQFVSGEAICVGLAGQVFVSAVKQKFAGTISNEEAGTKRKFEKRGHHNVLDADELLQAAEAEYDYKGGESSELKVKKKKPSKKKVSTRKKKKK